MKGLVAAIAIVTACACTNVERQLGETLSAAQLELRRGQVAAAQVLADKGVALTQSTPGTVSAWRFRLLRSEVQIAKLEMKAALPDLQATLPEGAEFDILRARQKYLNAQIQVAQGQFQPAIETLDSAGVMAASDPDLLLDIAVLGSQARLRLGRWQEAEERLNTVLTQSTERADRYRQALALNNLGMSRLVRNRFDEALPWFERVLAYNDLEQTRIYAVTQNNAGICFARLGQFDRAVSAQQQAVEKHDRSGRKTELMQAVGELGTTYLLQDDIVKAVPYLQRALSISTEAGLPDGAVWARNLAAASVVVANWDDAAKYNDEARRLNPANRPAKLVFNTATAAQIAEARGQSAEASRLFNEVLKTSATEPALQWVAHEGLAKLAVAAHQPREAAAHFEAALATVEKTRSALLKTDYKLSFLTRLIHFYRAYVDFLIDAGQIERALEVADSSRGRVLSEHLGAPPPSRSAASGFRSRAQQSGQVFVFYWLAPARSRVWVVTGSGIQSELLPPRDQIEPLVDQYQALVQNALADPLGGADNPGDRLYTSLVAPIAKFVPAGSSVVIVPDGALNRLNFETLPVKSGEQKHYWIADVTIQVAPSLAMLSPAAAQKQAAGRRSLLLVGDPMPRAPEFPSLTYASAEMTGITKHFGAGAVTELRAAAASPAGFRSAGPQAFSAIHFTSHAVANSESPMDSAVILSGPDNAFKLYARDVADMPLTADLVTVSACRSAGERAYSGEGLVGFAWAFLRAGSRRVVAGLWDVDDRSTAALMEYFYARLEAGDAPATALRAAKLRIMKEGTVRPYYWGPLQMFTVSS
jgi:CHAT domain-containing protein/tetratricopeptide (TPR) repeat protein